MGKYHRRAEWIWRRRDRLGDRSIKPEARQAEEGNLYVYFRRVVTVDSEVRRAVVDVSADGRYQLRVNGYLVGRGPARCNPLWQYYDTYDLAGLMRPGLNVVAALVHSYGHNTGWYELPRWEHGSAFGCGGWFLQGSIDLPEGETLLLDTGTTWRYLVSGAWRKDTRSGRQGYAEHYDARNAPEGWDEPDFDDTRWAQAQPLRTQGVWGSSDTVPFPVMVPRDIPFLEEETHRPRSSAALGEVDDARDAPSLEEALRRELVQPLSRCTVTDPHGLIGAGGGTTVTTVSGRSASLLLDFGTMQTGRVCMELEGPEGASVDFRYGERIEANGMVQVLPWKDAHIYAHRLILGARPLRWEMFERAGFRYLQLTVRNATSPLHVRAVEVNSSRYPAGRRGAFRSSDPMLNRIYEISAETMRCCMHDGYEDCPSREQRQWTNDQFLHVMANFGLFGDTKLTRKLLVQISQSQRADGCVMSVAPGDLGASTAANAAEFTLHWIMSVDAYLRYTGDLELIEELYPSVVKGLSWFSRHLDHEGLISDLPGTLWVDWAELDKRGQVTEVNARFVGCLRIGARFARTLGFLRDALGFDRMANDTSRAVNRLLWDPARGVYVDARHDGSLGRRVSQQGNAAAMYHGVAPTERWQPILAAIMDPEKVRLTACSVDYRSQYDDLPPFDEDRHVVLAHAFYMHFLHAVLARRGMHQRLLDNMREHWGAQVKAGATTWWEMWRVLPMHTLCHGFSSTPGFDLPTHILGVAPLEDGFVRFAIAPRPCDLKWAEGTFPSVRGDIPVAWERGPSSFDLRAEVPPNTTADLSLPELGGAQPLSISIDDRESCPHDLLTLGPGPHRVRALYPPSPPEARP